MSRIHVLIPPVPRGVYLTPAIVAQLALEWPTLPEPTEALLDAIRLGPEPDAYQKQLVIGEGSGIGRELKAAYRNKEFHAAWQHWAGDVPLDNAAAPLVLGLAVCGTINAQVSERARMAYMSIQRALDAAERRPARPELEPLHLGNGTVDMTKLVPKQE